MSTYINVRVVAEEKRKSSGYADPGRRLIISDWNDVVALVRTERIETGGNRWIRETVDGLDEPADEQQKERSRCRHLHRNVSAFAFVISERTLMSVHAAT